jgi:hypothetical protein
MASPVGNALLLVTTPSSYIHFNNSFLVRSCFRSCTVCLLDCLHELIVLPVAISLGTLLLIINKGSCSQSLKTFVLLLLPSLILTKPFLLAFYLVSTVLINNNGWVNTIMLNYFLVCSPIILLTVGYELLLLPYLVLYRIPFKIPFVLYIVRFSLIITSHGISTLYTLLIQLYLYIIIPVHQSVN